ncbi:MAG: ArsA family ATPase [Rhodocyclaceae bacterium]|nr:ArsA family ATPase [Rhodocyclaceae bacterium]
MSGQTNTTQGNQIARALAERRLIVVCGSGGVGKTTTSAALACAAAQQGRKVLVLTIDPARRLASALGLSELDNEPRKVSSSLFRAQGLVMKGKGELWAMMLDTKRTFDDVIRRYAPRPELAEQILGNLIYQQVSDALAGTQEYMAMEQLYELTRDDKYDLIVVDTPPTQHALDFLDAPERMMNVLDSGVVKLVWGGARKVGKSYLSWLRRSTKVVASLFERITGGELFGDMAEFFQAFDELYAGIRDRSNEVKQMLKSDQTLFFLVTSPAPSSMQESQYFLGKISGYGVTLGGIIVNRVHRLTDGTVPVEGALPEAKLIIDCLVKTQDSMVKDLRLKTLIDELLAAWQSYAAMASHDQHQIERLTAGHSAQVMQVPYFDSDIHDLQGLNRLGGYLLTPKSYG